MRNILAPLLLIAGLTCYSVGHAESTALRVSHSVAYDWAFTGDHADIERASTQPQSNDGTYKVSLTDGGDGGSKAVTAETNASSSNVDIEVRNPLLIPCVSLASQASVVASAMASNATGCSP